jgi:hypothetical protein
MRTPEAANSLSSIEKRTKELRGESGETAKRHTIINNIGKTMLHRELMGAENKAGNQFGWKSRRHLLAGEPLRVSETTNSRLNGTVGLAGQEYSPGETEALERSDDWSGIRTLIFHDNALEEIQKIKEGTSVYEYYFPDKLSRRLPNA